MEHRARLVCFDHYGRFHSVAIAAVGRRSKTRADEYGGGTASAPANTPKRRRRPASPEVPQRLGGAVADLMMTPNVQLIVPDDTIGNAARLTSEYDYGRPARPDGYRSASRPAQRQEQATGRVKYGSFDDEDTEALVENTADVQLHRLPCRAAHRVPLLRHL